MSGKEFPPCEVCGAASVVSMVDSKEITAPGDEWVKHAQVGPAHHFCLDHQRPRITWTHHGIELSVYPRRCLAGCCQAEPDPAAYESIASQQARAGYVD